MKTNRSNRFLSILRRFFTASAVVINFFGVSRAAQIDWAGTTDATWATASNWTGAVAPVAADTARFNLTAYPNQPNAGTSSIAGLVMGDGTTSTATLTLSGTQLTIGASGIDMKASAGLATISSPVTLGAAQTWQNASANKLTLSGAVTAAANLLTVNGSGNVDLTGAIGGTGGLTKLGTGTLTLSGTGSGNTGAFSIKQGTLTVSGGTITAANQIRVGDTGGTGTPVFNLTGGTVTATSSGNSLALGSVANLPGSVTISGGTFNSSTAAAFIMVGDNAVGSYSQTAGTVNTGSTGGLWIANNAGGSGSTVSITGGTFNATGGTSVLGVRGSYAFTVGGTAAVNLQTLQLGHTGGTTNNPTGRTVNLNGGTLRLTNGINYQAGTAVVNLNGGILQANSSTVNFWNHNANVTATLGASGGTIDTQGFTDTISQVIGGTGNLTKTGSGTLNLTGSNTYTGATSVNAGTLAIQETSNSSGGVSVSNGAALTINGTLGATLGIAAPIANLTLGSVSGTGGATLSFNNFASNSGQQLVDTTNFTVNGAALGSTVNVSGLFSAAGDYPLVTFANPTIGGNGFGALKLGTLPRGITANLLEDSQILWLQVTGFNPLKWDGAVSGGVWDVNSTANWQGVDTKYLDGDIVVFDNAASGTKNVSLSTTVSPASIVVENADYNISGIGTIAGTGSLNKNGTGTLTIGTNNSYTGITNINSGTVRTTGANAFGSTAMGTVVASGAVLDLFGTSLSAEPITLNGNGISSSGALINSSGFVASTSSVITLGTSAAVGGQGNLILAGDIVGTTGLTKVGNGVVFFSSRKSYTGDTVINGGVLDLTGGGGTGGVIRGTANVNAGATLRLTTGDATGYDLGTPRLNVINLNGGSMVIANTSNQTLGAAAVTMQGATLTGVSGANLDFFTSDNNQAPRSSLTTLASATPSIVSGVKLNMRQNDGLIFTVADGAAEVDLDVQSSISNSAGFTNNALTKNGSGTMRISGQSLYTVPTVVNEGTLIVPSTQSSTSYTVADGATLSINGAPGTSFNTTALTLNSTGSSTVNINHFGSQTLKANAPIRVSGNLTLDGTHTLNISGSFASAGVFPVVSYGALSGPSDFVLGSVPRSVVGASLDWNPTEQTYDLTITGVNPVYWNGNLSGVWSTSAANWLMSASATSYQENDLLILDDSATGTTAITLNSQVAPSQVSVNNTTKNYSISGTGGIAGSGALIKSGTGSLVLTTANRFTGGTTINGGTLQLGNGTTNGSVDGNILNQASLIVNNGSAQTYSGVISGTGSLTKSGSGTLTIGGENTYTGTTTISGGTLRVGTGVLGTLGTGTITNNANLEFFRDGPTQVNSAGVITGSGNVTYVGPSTPYSLGGQFIVDDANTYTGTTTVTSNARVNLTSAGGIGSGPLVVQNGGQVLFNAPGATTYSNPITISGYGWPEPGSYGALRLTNGAVLTGNITLAADSRITPYTSTGNITGVISGNANLDLYGGSNSNFLVIGGSSSNTYTGTTYIGNVQVSLSKTSGLAIPGDIVMDNTTSPTLWLTSSTQLSGSSILSFTGNSGNARVNLMGTTQTFRGIVNSTIASTAVIQNSESIGSGATASPVDYGTSNLVLNVPSGEDYAFLNGYLRNSTGVVNVVKNGTGRQTLGGGTFIDYTGTTSVNTGELRFFDMDDVASRLINVASGATLRIEAPTTRRFTGNTFASAVWTGSGTYAFSGAGIKEINGNVSTNLSLNSGALMDVQQGVLRLGNGGQLNTINNKADLAVASGATFNTWDCGNVYMDTLSGSGTITRGYTPDIGTSSTGNGNLYIGVDNGTSTFNGLISDQVGNVGSTLSLVKRGSGTQTLTGTNDYDGSTRIESGTLALSGSGNLTSTSGVTVLPGAVFDVSAKSTTFTLATGKSLTAGRTSGSGNDVAGSLNTGGSVNVVASGTPGTLTVSGDLGLTGGGSLLLDVSPSVSSNNDKIVVGGSLSLAGTTTVTPSFNGTPDTANPYTILTYTGSLTGSGAANLTSGLVNSRYSVSFNTDTPNEVRMVVSGTGKSLVWSAASGQNWVASATLPDATNLNWNADADNFQNLDSVTFDDSTDGTGAVTVNLTTSVNPSGILVNNPTRAYTISGTNGVIAGGGVLTKKGAAGLTLSNANTFGGGVTVVEGSVSLNNVSAAGTGTITIGHPDSGAAALTLTANVGSGTFNNPIQVTNNGTGTVTLAQPQNFSILAGTLTLNRATTITGAADRSAVSGKITGNVGTLTFGGTRTTLDNTVPNDFVGNVEIANAAIVQTQGPGSLPSTASVNMTGSGRLQLNAGYPQAINGLSGGTNGTTGVQIIAGSATSLTIGSNGGGGTFNGNIVNNAATLTVVKTGAGTQTFGGTNSYTGQTRVLGGTLALTNASGLAGSTLVHDNEGGSVDFGTLTSINLGGLHGSQNLTIPSSVTALTLGHGSNSDTAVYNGTISMSGAGATFTKQGLGNQTLGGSVSNSWAGNTSIISNGAPGNSSQGNLYLAKTGGAVAIPANTTVNFGTGTNTGQPNLRTVYDNQFGDNVTLSFGNNTSGYCRFDLLGTTQTLSAITSTTGGGIVQNSGLGRYTGSAVAVPATLVLSGTGTYTFNGILRDTDDGANPLRRLNIKKTGSGTQTFANTNGSAFTGYTAVDAGTLVFNRTSAGDDYHSATAYSIATGATLQFDASANGRISQQSGDITGNGTFRKTGAGITYLANNSGGSQYFFDLGTSGLIDVQGGNLNSISTRATNKADIQVAGGATLTINGAGGSATTAYFDGLNGGTSASNAALDLGRNTVLGVNGDGGTFIGNITGGGGITKEGAATLTLSGANAGSPAVPTSASSFSGNITVNGGKLVGAAKGSVFGSASNARVITLNAGTTMEFQGPNAFGGHSGSNTPTFVITNATLTNSDPLATNVINNGLRNITLNNGTITAAAGNGTSAIDAVTRPGEGYGCWGLNGTITSSGTSLITTTATGMAGRYLLGSGLDTTMNVVDGTLTVAAPLQTGDSTTLGGLVKTGVGRLVLSAVNLYSTPTTINGGTLELTGSLVAASGVTSPSNITVNAAGTLSGTGSATGALTVNGNVAPGSSIGTLAVGSTTFNATGTLKAEINSSALTADKLAITGNLTIDPAANLNVTDLGSGTPTAAKLVLMTYTGTWNGGTFAGLDNESTLTVNGNTYTIRYDDTDTGLGAVTLRIGTVGTAYDTWASSYGLSGPNADKGADPDGDGVKNILEFATNSNPTNGSSGPRVYPLMHVIGSDNALTYTIAVRKDAAFTAAGSKQTATKDSIVYLVEASNDLSTWATVQVTEVTGADKTAVQAALGTVLTTPALDADWEWHTFRTDSGSQADPSDYIRLKVSEAP